MSLTSGIVFYMVCWFVTFMVINPLWQRSQAEDGEVVPGTPPSAPVDAMVAKKAIWTTVWASLAFAALYATIEFRLITLDDLNWIDLPSDG